MMVFDDIGTALNKFFSLCLLFTVTSINLWLIGNFLYWKNVFSKDKKCIIASIAFSDLLVGLFCLPVEATLHFDIYLGGPGCVLSYVNVYTRFFSPFVYGIGITVLCIELVLKCKGLSCYDINKFLTLFISSVPWLLAVIIVIPLIFSGTPSTSCWYLPLNDRGLCIWSATTFLPIVLFLVAWIITAFFKWETVSAACPVASYSVWRDHSSSDVQQQSHALASQSLATDNGRDDNSSLPARDSTMCVDTTNSAVDYSSHSQPVVFRPSTEAASYPATHHETQQLLTVSSSQQYPQQGNLRSPDVVAATTHHENKDLDLKREALYLLLISLVFVVLTVPFALYNLIRLSSFLYGNNSFTSVRTFILLKWMQMTRSLFIPLIWSIIFYSERCRISPP